MSPNLLRRALTRRWFKGIPVAARTRIDICVPPLPAVSGGAESLCRLLIKCCRVVPACSSGPVEVKLSDGCDGFEEGLVLWENMYLETPTIPHNSKQAKTWPEIHVL